MTPTIQRTKQLVRVAAQLKAIYPKCAEQEAVQILERLTETRVNILAEHERDHLNGKENAMMYAEGISGWIRDSASQSLQYYAFAAHNEEL